jgi:hypothetical protein
MIVVVVFLLAIIIVVWICVVKIFVLNVLSKLINMKIKLKKVEDTKKESIKLIVERFATLIKIKHT